MSPGYNLVKFDRCLTRRIEISTLIDWVNKIYAYSRAAIYQRRVGALQRQIISGQHDSVNLGVCH